MIRREFPRKRFMNNNTQEDKTFKTSLTMARHGGIVIASSLLSNVIRFLIQVLLVRSLGPQKYGLYTIGFSIFTMASQISQLGLSEGIIKFGRVNSTENDQPRLKGLLKLAIIIAIMVSTFTAIFIFVSAPYIAKNVFHKSELEFVLKFFAISIPFCVFAATLAASFRATQSILHYSIIQYILHPVIYIICIAVACLVGLTIIHVLESFVLAWFLVAVLGALVIFKACPVLLSKVKPVYEPRKLFRFTVPVFISKFLPLIINHFDKVILGKMVLASDIGIYSAGGKIAAQIVIFMQAFNLIFSPVIAEHFHNNRIGELNALFKTVTRWTISLTIPFVLCIIIYADLIMNMFGSDYLVGKNILILCCLAQFVSVCTGPLEYMLIMGKQDLDLINNCIFVFINIILNFILVKNYGILGAALALGLSMIIINLVRLIEMYILYRLWPYSLNVFKSFFAAFITYGLVTMLNNFLPFGNFSYLITSLLLFGIYAGMLYFMGFNAEDRAILVSIKRKVGGIFMNRGSP